MATSERGRSFALVLVVAASMWVSHFLVKRWRRHPKPPPAELTSADQCLLGVITSIQAVEVFHKVTYSAANVRPHVGTVQELRLPNQGGLLRCVPPLTMRLLALRHVDLSGSMVTSLPSTIMNLSQLQVLNVSRCELGSLPPELDQLHNLTQLDVSFQRPSLGALLPRMSGLSRLTDLNAMGNALLSLPDDFGNLTGLRVLGLKSNRLSRLPPSFTRLTNLVELFITDNCLLALPEGMGSMSSLVKVQASFNRLTALPADLANLPRLEMLRVAVCDIASFPESLTCGSGWPRLSWCSLGGNPACAPLPAPRRGLNVPPKSEALPVRDAFVSDGLGDEDIASSSGLPTGALHEKLGDGASGAVFLSTLAELGIAGSDGAAGNLVAVKVFRADISPDGRTCEEVAIACALDHPRLTRVTAVVGTPRALAMGLVRGQPMADKPTSQHLLRCKWGPSVRFSLEQALRVGHDVASALQYMHSLALCHGDVYAHNIMLDDDFHATLCDFGASFSYTPGECLWQAMEVCAYGLFLQDLAERLHPATHAEAATALRGLAAACTAQVPAQRPSFEVVLLALGLMME